MISTLLSAHCMQHTAASYCLPASPRARAARLKGYRARASSLIRHTFSIFKAESSTTIAAADRDCRAASGRRRRSYDAEWSEPCGCGAHGRDCQMFFGLYFFSVASVAYVRDSRIAA
ncbi:hypothetical protein FIBSPDRAFT_254082 [Athelia psychrophila]|uniref:Uncharacterized protein n=1 Tax=Athelia psychrophila TaxID=1759441 RepID=A0A165XMS8_9AGAM|nr:hypothetical protein FIBSPDRAFT_254082 [Fibularhizoctonia sp. CBS 109695]